MTEDLPQLQELCGCAKDAVEVIIGEIENQRDLIHAEKGELDVNPEPVHLNGLIRAVADSVQNAAEHAVDMRFEWKEELVAVSDPILLRRVVTNMVKNAAEAAGDQPIRISTCRQGNSITIEVHNAICMPTEIQLQVFKRSFSTKGEGRGYGTYGMKLFGERYLGGEVPSPSSAGSRSGWDSGVRPSGEQPASGEACREQKLRRSRYLGLSGGKTAGVPDRQQPYPVPVPSRFFVGCPGCDGIQPASEETAPPSDPGLPHWSLEPRSLPGEAGGCHCPGGARRIPTGCAVHRR